MYQKYGPNVVVDVIQALPAITMHHDAASYTNQCCTGSFLNG